MNALWKHLSKQDKDTFVFVAIFAIVVFALVKIKADPIYIILSGAVFILLYIFMRIALVRTQLLEREQAVKRLPSRKARQIVDANATKVEKQKLDKFVQSAKRTQT
ncbi:hypothetical protein G6L28_03695 [Agrobacterium larrymoorei]|uniref:hypothetical protein n=1 Tax=Agrobacterium larrymoorei TaxID=160699 RepID=UPI001571E6DF|nr:hypothetical protein [Agrobacterium larrymoorei]NTJ41703.1 hypothetical protein [Agrobacterium larrymoorei]